ncbi:MAG: hypothetical protein ACK5N9_04785, partial [Pirellula sp.]
IQDGGEGDDSFPSWGLKVRSSVMTNTLVHRLMFFNNFGRTNRVRTILSKWSGATASLCPKPESQLRKARDSRSRAD